LGSQSKRRFRIASTTITAEDYPARGFYLPKSSGGTRLIGIPTVRDRVVQRWLLNEVYPAIEEELTDSCYAYRPGRSIHQAVRHFYTHYQVQPAWVVKSDIASFYDSLSRAVLMAALDRLPIGTLIAQTIEQQLDAGISVRGRLLYLRQGVLQGAVLSGALANLYLSEFDRTCLRAGINLVRYGDDFAISCRSLNEAERVLDRVADWLREIHLKLAPEKTEVFPPDREFTFLGYQFRDGQVFAPPPPETHQSRSPSGMPTRPRPIHIHAFLSRPPQVRAVRPKKTLPAKPAAPHHCFADTMTTLYITDQGSYLKARNYQMQVFHKGELRYQIPVNRVSHIVLFGCCNLSHGAVRLALSRRIPVLYLSQRGRYFGRLENEGQAKVDYLSRQVERAADTEFTRQQAETFVRAKLHNSRVLLQRLSRRCKSETARTAVDAIARIADNLPLAESMDALRGYEGNTKSG